MRWTGARGLGDRMVAVLVLALLLLLALALLGLAGQRALQRQASSGDALQRSQQVLTALATLQLAVANADEAGDADTVAQARAGADAQMATLRALLSHDPAQYSRLFTVGPLLSQRFDALAGTEPRRRGAPATPPAELRAQRSHLQAAMLALQEPAQAALASARQASQDTAASARAWQWGGTAAALLAVAALAAVGWRLLQALEHQRAAAQHAQAAQRAATSDLQAVLTTTASPVCVLDADGRFLRLNPACAALWGRAADALIGKPLLDGVLPDDRRRTQVALDKLLAGDAVPEFRHRVQRADGSTALLAWQATSSASSALSASSASSASSGSSATPPPNNGGLVCTGHDITELDALRSQAAAQGQALQQGQLELAAAQARAQESDDLKALFLSTLGQSLRSPLDHVDNLAGVLLQGLSGPLAPQQQRQLQQLRASTQQVRAVLQDMLDIASIEAGALRLRHEPFDLSEAITKVAGAARQRAQDKGVLLQLHLADDLGYARGDERRFAQALGKLLDNAVRFTDAGSITLRATCEQAEPGGQLQISITDTGVGIAADDMARLYQPFRPLQPEPGTGDGRAHAGVGLGLAIAQRLAVLMGGSISASSQPQQGSTFTLRLPSDSAVAALRG